MLEDQVQSIRRDITALESRILQLKRYVNHSSDLNLQVCEEEKKAIIKKIHQLKDYLHYVEAESQIIVGKDVRTVDSIRSAIYYACNPITCVTRFGPSSWVTSIEHRNIRRGDSLTIYDAQFHQPITVFVGKRDEARGLLQLYSEDQHFDGFEYRLPCDGDKMIQVGIGSLDERVVPILCESQWFTTKFDHNGFTIGTRLPKGCLGGGCFSLDFSTLYGVYCGVEEDQEVGLYVPHHFL
jgi:hypothetical protein